MSDEIEEKAMAVVAAAVAGVPMQRAMAAALMRHAGNALAKLGSHEDAALRHTTLARKHFARMSQVPGRPRR